MIDGAEMGWDDTIVVVFDVQKLLHIMLNLLENIPCLYENVLISMILLQIPTSIEIEVMTQQFPIHQLQIVQLRCTSSIESYVTLFMWTKPALFLHHCVS